MKMALLSPDLPLDGGTLNLQLSRIPEGVYSNKLAETRSKMRTNSFLGQQQHPLP